jgi:hypothetical protein
MQLFTIARKAEREEKLPHAIISAQVNFVGLGFWKI